MSWSILFARIQKIKSKIALGLSIGITLILMVAFNNCSNSDFSKVKLGLNGTSPQNPVNPINPVTPVNPITPVNPTPIVCGAGCALFQNNVVQFMNGSKLPLGNIKIVEVGSFRIWNAANGRFADIQLTSSENGLRITFLNKPWMCLNPSLNESVSIPFTDPATGQSYLAQNCDSPIFWEIKGQVTGVIISRGASIHTRANGLDNSVIINGLGSDYQQLYPVSGYLSF